MLELNLGVKMIAKIGGFDPANKPISNPFQSQFKAISEPFQTQRDRGGYFTFVPMLTPVTFWPEPSVTVGQGVLRR